MKTFTKTSILFFFIFLLTNCTLLIGNCFGQSITWQRVYDGPSHSYDGAYASCIADSSNMYIGGYSGVPTYAYLIKINKFGDTLWTKWLVGSGHEIAGMCSTSDGGCVITGYGGTVYAARYSKFGDLLWLRYYGGQNSRQIIKTLDGGYIGCGDVGSAGNNGYIFKIDSLGNLEWDGIYLNKIFRSIENTNNGNYIVCGYYNLGNGYLAEINSNGTIIWEKYMNPNIPDFRKINNINNGFILGGTKVDSLTSQYDRAFLLIIDTNGNQKLFKEFDAPIAEDLINILVINSNKYSFITNSYTTSAFSSRIFFVDSLLNVIKIKLVYDSRGDELLQSILLAPISNTSDIMYFGIAHIIPGDFEDFYAIRTDSSLIYFPPFGVRNESQSLPNKFRLLPNYPNPFNPSTTIKYDLPKDGMITIKIYDLLGRVVISSEEYKKAGSYDFSFNGSNYASGLYFYKIESGLFSDVKKMVLLK